MPPTDDDWMGEAIALARAAAARGEVPVGAVVVRDGIVIGRGGNAPIAASDPTAHAEIAALRDAGRALGNYRLPGCELFVTLEPCAMCVGAILACDATALVYAAPNPEGAAGTAIQLAQHAGLPRRVKVVSGIRREEADELLAATRIPVPEA